eukprot:1035641-Amphidinium_carterae.1
MEHNVVFGQELSSTTLHCAFILKTYPFDEGLAIQRSLSLRSVYPASVTRREDLLRQELRQTQHWGGKHQLFQIA